MNVKDAVIRLLNLALAWRAYLAVVLLYFTPGLAAFASDPYQPLDEDCAGLPKLPIGSLEGTCLGMLADDRVGFIMPRKVIEVPGKTQLLVTDMGGWSNHRGILWRLDFNSEEGFLGPFKAEKLATGLSLPHDIRLGPDGAFYLGEAHQISRFELDEKGIRHSEVVIPALPYVEGAYQHPLTNFVFMPNHDLLINIGSKTDDCSAMMSEGRCEEVDQVGLRLYPYQPETGTWSLEYSLYATGLRNSMALVVHDSGTVMQAENSSDLPDADEPYEEINHIRSGGFYGWPYCLNRRFAQQIITDGCDRYDYEEPHSLMPPHVAPLDMIYYDSQMLPMLTGQLLVSWHGYRVVGNRVVSYPVDERGMPYLRENVRFNRDPIQPATEFTQHEFEPRGGSSADAQHLEVVSHWNERDGLRPEGAPVGLFELSDGTVLIVDDKNKAILRLAPGSSYKDQAELPLAVEIDGFDFTGEARQVMENKCAGCHSELIASPGHVLNQAHWLREQAGMTVLEYRLTLSGKTMPPDGRLGEERLKTLIEAIE